VTDEVPRPVRQINTDVPGWFESVVVRLLAKNPAERFQTAAEVAELLEKCLAHVQQPLTAPLPAIPGHPTGRRRRRWPEAAAGLAMVLVATGLILTPHGPTPTTDPGDGKENLELVVGPKAAGEVQVRKADVIAEELLKTGQWAQDIEYRLRFPERRLIDPIEDGIADVSVRAAVLKTQLKDRNLTRNDDAGSCDDDKCPEKKTEARAKPPKRNRNSP